MKMTRIADHGPVLVTGAAGQLGAVGRTVTGLLLDGGLAVRAMVRREDDRAAALRAASPEVVAGDNEELQVAPDPRLSAIVLLRTRHCAEHAARPRQSTDLLSAV